MNDSTVFHINHLDKESQRWDGSECRVLQSAHNSVNLTGVEEHFPMLLAGDKLGQYIIAAWLLKDFSLVFVPFSWGYDSFYRNWL